MLLLSVLLLTSLGRFTIPNGSDLGLGSKKTESNGQLNGELVVKVDANMTEIPASKSSFIPTAVSGNDFTAADPVTPGLFRNVPLGQVQVTITNEQNRTSHLNNYTDSKGILNMSLPFSSYFVTFDDWRFNNTQLSVQIEAGRVTFVSAYLNATSYAVQSIVLSDPYSSGMVVPWESTYIRLPNTDYISPQSANSFLITDNIPFVVTLDSTFPSGIIPITITSTSMADNSDWLTLQVGFPLPIASIRTMNLYILSPQYSVTIQ